MPCVPSRPLPAAAASPAGAYYLAYPSNQALPQHVHDFESWIVAEAQAAEA